MNFKENILYFFVTDIIIMLLKFPLLILSKCKNEKCCCCSNRFFIFNWMCCQNDLYGFLHALKHVFFKALLLYDQNSHKSLTTYVLLLAGTTIFFLVAAAGCVDLWQSEYPKPIFFFFKLFCQIFVIIEDFSTCYELKERKNCKILWI